MDQIYQFECSVVVSVSREFAWRFWSNVNNWTFDRDIESVEVYGPFAAGTHGITQSRSSGRIEWILHDVQQGISAVMQIPVPGVDAQFSMRFEDSGSEVRITQHVTLKGEKARELGQMLEAGIPQGMQRLSEKMIEAAEGDT